jgi:hypothetical protein
VSLHSNPQRSHDPDLGTGRSFSSVDDRVAISDFEALEAWARSTPHREWWRDLLRSSRGTAWPWSRPDAFERVDVLFVDEAAQMSPADVLAVSHAAKTVVLIGDPGS